MWKRGRSHWFLAAFLIVGSLIVLSMLIMGAVQTLMDVFAKNVPDTIPGTVASSRTDTVVMTSLQESVTVSQTAQKSFCVVIDPGHGGGKSPGVVCAGVEEETINLEIALRVKEKLEEEGIRVILTRTADAEVDLQERAEIANENGADIFISIHQNSLAEDTTTNGMETWYCGEKTDGSRRLAELIQEMTVLETGAKNRGLRESSELVVIRETEMASCLLEVGFLSCTEERSRLLSETYQDQVACGIANAVITYRSIL